MHVDTTPLTTPHTAPTDALRDLLESCTMPGPAAVPSDASAAAGGTSAASSPSLDDLTFDGAFFLVMLLRIQSINQDLKDQVEAIMRRNQLKKLYNERLGQLNTTLLRLAKEKVPDDEEAEITVPRSELPYSAFHESYDAEGNPVLIPRDGSEAHVGVVVPDKTVGDLVTIRVRPSALKYAMETLRSRIDSLNSDGEIATVRLHDLQNKAQFALTELTEIMKKRHETLMRITGNLA